MKRGLRVADMAQDISTEEMEEGNDAVGENGAGDKANGEGQEGTSRRSRLRKPLLLAAPIVVVIIALFFYITGGRYESTDDAYIQAGLVGISANVSGQVVAVGVHENEHVRTGQILFRIDPSQYQTAVDAAQAKLVKARAEVEAQRADYHAANSKVQSERAQLDYAQREAARQKELLAEGISSQDQYDLAVLAVRTAQQAIDTAGQNASSIVAAFAGGVDGSVDKQPAVREALAELEQAKLNMGYTVIRAAQSGIVTKVSQLQVGDYVTASKPVFTLVGEHKWVKANFKENQLRYMRLGQPATIEIDAFPGQKLKGHISSFSPGTGNIFSLLPPENATGNWVKVVQRLPVEIEIDNLPASLPFHAGLSADVTVDTGHKRHLFARDTPPATPAAARAPAGK